MVYLWFRICEPYYNIVTGDIVIPLTCMHSYIAVKPVLSGHSKNRQKVLKTNGSLMKVRSIAECSLGAFCITFDLY